MAAPNEAELQRGSDQYSKERWYAPDLDNLSPSTRYVLETYSKIPKDQVINHCKTIRDKAWAIHPYPCIGQWRFLDLSIGKHPQYQAILNRMLTGNQIFLDLGCAFAQDIRRLVADGVDSSKCYGSDLRLDFLDLGYELFSDKRTLKTHFIDADVFDDASALKELDGKVDIIDASSFFHLFNLDEQKVIARRVVKLLKPQRDSLLVGRHVGNVMPGEFRRRVGAGTRYRHDVETWRQMWEEVGAEIGVEFMVSGDMVPVEEWINQPMPPEDKGGTRMTFTVRRLN